MGPSDTSHPDVLLLTADEMARAVAATVAASGYTVEQLAEQAADGAFETERARLAWHIVKGHRASAVAEAKR